MSKFHELTEHQILTNMDHRVDFDDALENGSMRSGLLLKESVTWRNGDWYMTRGLVPLPRGTLHITICDIVGELNVEGWQQFVGIEGMGACLRGVEVRFSRSGVVRERPAVRGSTKEDQREDGKVKCGDISAKGGKEFDVYRLWKRCVRRG